MTRQDALRVSIGPALYLLPAKMTSPEAEAMLLTIGMQESRFTHREQIRGPAKSYFQFELIGVRGVWEHHATATYAKDVCDRLDFDVSYPGEIHELIAVNDVLAAVFARLLLYTVPAALPSRDDPQTGWDQYLWAWRPGKPHRRPWDKFYRESWDIVG